MTALDATGAHKIRFMRTDYYHITAQGQRRIMLRDLYSVLAHVQSQHGRECVGIDDSGRYVAGWQVGGEPVEADEEFNEWILGV